MPVRNRDVLQLRAVAPLLVTATKELVGSVLLATNGIKTVGVTSSELLRPWEAKQLSIATSLDGSQLLPLSSWGLGRYSGVGLIELGSATVTGGDVIPVEIGAVCASVETRGAPAAIVAISGKAPNLVRDVIPVWVDTVDTGGGMSDDVITKLATPQEPADATKLIDGAILFAWFPPDPVLGRKSEVLAVAMSYPYRTGTFKPRELPAFAELIGLDDLGRALISSAPVPERPELKQVTGEIADVKSDPLEPVLDGLDEYKKKRERP